MSLKSLIDRGTIFVDFAYWLNCEMKTTTKDYVSLYSFEKIIMPQVNVPMKWLFLTFPQKLKPKK